MKTAREMFNLADEIRWTADTKPMRAAWEAEFNAIIEQARVDGARWFKREVDERTGEVDATFVVVRDIDPEDARKVAGAPSTAPRCGAMDAEHGTCVLEAGHERYRLPHGNARGPWVAGAPSTPCRRSNNHWKCHLKDGHDGGCALTYVAGAPSTKETP